MPEFRADIRKKLAGLGLHATREAEILEELGAHLDDQYQQLIASGLGVDEARRLALEDLDDLTLKLRSIERVNVPEVPVLGATGRDLFKDLWQDVRYGLRALLKSPAMTGVAVLTLALGVGMNAAIFSFVHAILLRPLPYPNPERLVMIWESRPREGVFNNVVSPEDFLDWRDRQRTFDAVATLDERSMDLTGTGEPERVVAMGVSTDFFLVLGVAPATGRDFGPGEDIGPHRLVILSRGLWLRRFGGDPSVVGKAMTLDGEARTIIGVMPALEVPVTPPFVAPDLWYPLDFTEQSMRTRTNHFLFVHGRLRQGVTIEQAQQDMDRVSAQIQRETPQQNQNHGSHLVPLHEQLVGAVRRPLSILAAAVGFVLLIACANVANLLLARGASRQRELAIRVALGASRVRIVRQVSIECLWLAVLGLLAGLPLATWGIQFLKFIAPAGTPLVGDARLDVTVLLFMTGIAAITAALSGLVPAFQASRASPHAVVKETNPGAGGTRQRFRSGLIVAEIALSFVLLTGAGLMTRSLWNLIQVQPGFDAEHVVTVPVMLSRLQTENRPVPIFLGELMDGVRALRGVTAVGLTSHMPLTGADSRIGVEIEDGAPSDQPNRVHWRVVSPDYFGAMKMRLVEGRLPTEQDASNAAGLLPRDLEIGLRSSLVVINRTAARRYWPGQSAVGKRLRVPGLGPDWREVIGVVEDVKHWGLASPVNPEAYFQGLRVPATLVIRTEQSPASIAASLREEIRRLDANLPVPTIRPMNEVVERSMASARFYLILLTIFGALAVVLAASGIYGVVSYSVAQNTREIGVRIALGAQPVTVLLRVLGQGLVLALIGVLIGLGAALGLTRSMAALLFEVTPTDPVTFMFIAVLMVALTLLACYVPARRAATTNPVTVLRES